MKRIPNQIEQNEVVLPANSTPRFKWTRELHQCFVDAVSQLGGTEKATPKSVMQTMGIPGITLFHLKSHLQKYRLAKRKYGKVGEKRDENIIPHVAENQIQPQLHNSREMLQMQMEVQKKLQKQIEVQGHLQLRIEAQGKYLQSVLKQAQETLASYSLYSSELEAAKLEISYYQVNCSVPKQTPNADCSSDSCLTSVDCCNNRSAESNGIEHPTEEIDLNT